MMRIFQNSPCSSKSPSDKPTQTQVQRRIDKLVKQFRRDLEEQFGERNELMTLDEVEDAAVKIRQEVGRAIAEEMTQAQVDAAQEKEQGANKCVCQHCNRAQRPYRGSKDRTIVTMAGDIFLKRRVYYCRRCKGCTMPVDRQLRLPEHRFTPRVEIWVARSCMKHPYVEAMEDFRDLAGVHVSAKEAQRITNAIGKYAQEAMQSDIDNVIRRQPRSHLHSRHPEAMAEQHHDPRLTGYISMDGVMVLMDAGAAHEAKLSRVRLVQEAENKVDKPRELKNLYSFQFGGKDKADECAQQMYVNAARAGITELTRLVAIADGAAWIWLRIARCFPKAVQILDWYHALEYLNGVIKECVKAELAHLNPDQVVSEELLSAECKVRVEEAETLMWEGKVSELIRTIQKLPHPTAQATESVRQAVGYYRSNRDRMHYDEYRARGFDIGSGPMESGCKQVVTARMNQAGMRWSEGGAKAVGTLRAVWLSKGRWAELVGGWPGRSLSQTAPC